MIPTFPVVRFNVNDEVVEMDLCDYARLRNEKLSLKIKRAQDGRVTSVAFIHNSLNLPLAEFVLTKKDGYIVDHIDRDPLNNRRENLRYITRTANNRNRGMQSNNTSGFVGVVYHKHRGYYCVVYVFEGVWHRKCGFYVAAEAAKYYDSLVRQFNPDPYAVTNESLGLLVGLNK